MSQAKSRQDGEINNQERFYKVYADIGEIILNFMTGEFFLHFASRIGRIVQGSWLPSSGLGSSHVVAGLLDIQESTVKGLVKRHSVPIYRPSDGNMFKLEDLAVRAGGESAPDMPPGSMGVALQKTEPLAPQKHKEK